MESPYSPGQVVGEVYRLDELLGRGRFASVYAATDTSKDERVALKIFNPDLALKSGGGRRFIRRARVATDQPHPAIVPILERKITKEKIPYMVMELLEGRTLQQEVALRGAFPLEKALRVMRTPLSALAAIHEGGTSHRDVNPCNIFLCGPESPHPSVRLMDYGVAWDLVEHLAVSPDVIGSTSYLAPEFLLNPGKVWTPAIDVFAIGMVLFHVLTADLPFNKTNPAYGNVVKSIEVYTKGLYDLPGPSAFVSSIPPPIDDVVRKALSVNPKERFLTAGEMLEALESASKIHPAAFSSPSSRDEAPRPWTAGAPESGSLGSTSTPARERATLRTSLKPNFGDFPLLLSEETEITELPESSAKAKWLDWPTEIVKPSDMQRGNHGGTIKIPSDQEDREERPTHDDPATSIASDGEPPKRWIESSTVPYEKLSEDRTLLLSDFEDPSAWDPSNLSDVSSRKQKKGSSGERESQQTSKWKPRRADVSDEEMSVDQSGEFPRREVMEETSPLELPDETYLLAGQDDETVMELADGPPSSPEMEDLDDSQDELDTVREDSLPPPDSAPNVDDDAPTLMHNPEGPLARKTEPRGHSEPSFDTSADRGSFDAIPSDPPPSPSLFDSPGSGAIRIVLLIGVFIFFAAIALAIVWATMR